MLEGNNGSGVYDAGTDTLVYRGTDGTWQVTNGSQGCQIRLFYRDANGSGAWDAGEDIFIETGAHPEPHSVNASPGLDANYRIQGGSSPAYRAGTAGTNG